VNILITRIDELLKWVDHQKITLTVIRKNIKLAKEERKKYLYELKYFRQALKRIQQVGKETQQQTIIRVNKLVTSAIRDVFQDDGYDFEMEVSFTDRSMSVDLFLIRDGEKFDPLECCSYGVVDVLCFALRISAWSICPKRSTLLFDEPFKNVSKKYRERLGKFVRKVSEQLDFQFIVTTHMPELSENAHKVFHLVKKGKSSILCNP